MNILATLKDRFRPALAALIADPVKVTELLDMIRPAQDSKFGDCQANFAMPLGKQLGQPPRDVAAQLVAAAKLDDLCQQPEIAGPGFINLRLRDDWLADQLNQAVPDNRLGIPPVQSPRTIVVDYSSPNVAKPMHVGHIRSTVIGDSLTRTLRFLGHRVISDNHIGDWGTQFGMIIYGYKHFVDRAAYLERLADVERLKVLPKTGDKAADKKTAQALSKAQDSANVLTEEISALETRIAAVKNDAQLSQLAAVHANIDEAILQETAKLHANDPGNFKLWHEFLPHCRDEIARVYRRLTVTFDYEQGESFYHDRLAPVVEDLRKKGLAEDSQGAVVVFVEGFDTPMIVQKKDGAFLYSTSDLATIQFRDEEWHPSTVLYVVDHRQSEHFEKLFAVARRWGYRNIDFRHVKFGTVMGADGKPFKTREGTAAGLESLLDEAVTRAAAVVAEDDTDGHLSADQRREIAEVVGIGALKYADLSQNRTSDYTFSYDKMLLMNGNTATYMQYSYTRVRSICS
ncbi:MAG: arginine--tRNA ligase, partial [Planctomycetia bacterium]|nr:arginine--tRNA ligase [Planctomycetia bacterium]